MCGQRERDGSGTRRLLISREGVDTATPTGRAIAAIMATLAELELELGRERRASSRDSRRARGLPTTKPLKLSPERQEQLRRLAATGESVRELACVRNWTGNRIPVPIPVEVVGRLCATTVFTDADLLGHTATHLPADGL